MAVAAGGGAGAAEIVVSINKASQTMLVLVDGVETHKWIVSTGIGGGPHDGSYRPGRMERKWFSRKYNMAPMPYSIFFDGNYAIHGTAKIAQLGRRASKGCVRLHPRDAAVLFDLVGRNRASTEIVVAGASHVRPGPPPEPEPPLFELPALETAAAGILEPQLAARLQPRSDDATATVTRTETTGSVALPAASRPRSDPPRIEE
jgi:hypothetical protein